MKTDSMLMPSLGAALLCALTQSAYAAATLDSLVQVRGFHYPSGPAGAVWNELTFNGGASTTFDDTVTDPASGSSQGEIYRGYRYDVEASSSASFVGGPVLKARAQMDLIGAPFTPISASYVGDHNHRVNAVASLADDITLSVPGVAVGTPLTLSLSFSVTGFTSTLLPGQIGGGIAFLPPYTPAFLGSSVTGQTDTAYNFNSSLPGMFVFTDTFLNGTPKRFTLTLYASVTSDYSTAFTNYEAAGYYTTQGRSEFGSTVVLSGIDVTDSNSDPVAGAQLMSSDNAAWQPVPEPSALLLLVAGVVAMTGRRVRRGLE